MTDSELLPYRGDFGAPRPDGLPRLPPAPMPARLGVNPLKAWRWVGCFGPELMIAVARVRVGPARQASTPSMTAGRDICAAGREHRSSWASAGRV